MDASKESLRGAGTTPGRGVPAGAQRKQRARLEQRGRRVLGVWPSGEVHGRRGGAQGETSPMLDASPSVAAVRWKLLVRFLGRRRG